MSNDDTFLPLEYLEEEIDRYVACGVHDWQPDEEKPERLRCTRCRYVRYPHRPHGKVIR